SCPQLCTTINRRMQTTNVERRLLVLGCTSFGNARIATPAFVVHLAWVRPPTGYPLALILIHIIHISTPPWCRLTASTCTWWNFHTRGHGRLKRFLALGRIGAGRGLAAARTAQLSEGAKLNRDNRYKKTSHTAYPLLLNELSPPQWSNSASRAKASDPLDPLH